MSRVISGIMVIYGGTGLRLFLDDRKGQNCKSWRSLEHSRTRGLKRTPAIEERIRRVRRDALPTSKIAVNGERERRMLMLECLSS
jgi:hypothetical protein